MRDARHAHTCYRDFHEWVGGEDCLDAEPGVPRRPEDIWRHVHPRSAFFMERRDEPHGYIGIEAECDREKEHGLLLVGRNGERLTKCGQSDGHPANHGSDPDVVHDALDAEWTKRPDAQQHTACPAKPDDRHRPCPFSPLTAFAKGWHNLPPVRRIPWKS